MYGYLYMVIHCSDLYGFFLCVCERFGVEFVIGVYCVGYENGDGVVMVIFVDGMMDIVEFVVVVDGLYSVVWVVFVGDELVNFSYVVYWVVVLFELVWENEIYEKDVVVYIGLCCYFV